MSKELHIVDEVPNYHGGNHTGCLDHLSGMDSKTGRLNEAGEIYGDLQTAEEYGYVSRGYIFDLKKFRTLAYFHLDSSRGISSSLHWTFSGDWVCSNSSWTPFCSPKLYFDWNGDLCHDAVLRRDGNMAFTSGSHSSVLCSIC